MYLQSFNVVKNPHDRVRNHSPKSFNRAIDLKTISVIESTIANGPIAINQRLNTLDKEWDIDRVMMAYISGVTMAQLSTAMTKKNSNWLWGSLIQAPFLLLYATFGWSPSVLVFRKLGLRTRFEIQDEREVLLNALQSVDLENYENNIAINEWDVYESI
ncbi:MAG: hypothetical protein PHY93_09275 [Bacteriovorax sp.]|nr:hypothetical protein [Bacteriovorax sp.]